MLPNGFLERTVVINGVQHVLRPSARQYNVIANAIADAERRQAQRQVRVVLLVILLLCV